MNTTVIRSADWVVAWDGENDGHVYRNNADVAFAGDRLVFVGKGYDGPADTEIDDIGRLAVGAKADLVLVDVTHPAMMPAREPLRTLITIAGDRAVRDVFVDGRHVLEDGEPVHLDHRAACEELAEIQARAVANLPSHDWNGRDADALMPRMYGVAP